jgi:threonine/homoserine/homoserine lactone efflux protein
MVDSSKLALFLTAALLLAIAPGPGMLYVLARSLAGGRREGVLSALGTFVGGMVHVLAAAAGVSVVLARSAVAFATVKYAGAAYLCFLGVRMILAALRDNDELPTAALPQPGIPSGKESPPRSSIRRPRCFSSHSFRNSSIAKPAMCSRNFSRWARSQSR